MDFPYENKCGGNFPPNGPSSFCYGKISENVNFQAAVKVVWQAVLTQNFAFGISFDTESEFGIHFVSDSMPHSDVKDLL